MSCSGQGREYVTSSREGKGREGKGREGPMFWSGMILLKFADFDEPGKVGRKVVRCSLEASQSLI